MREELGTLAVTVGICAFNEGGRISRSLESLLFQSLPEGFELEEVLVVASGCTDGTERAVAAWARNDPRIVLIRETQRRGKTSALNLILRRYRGDILVILNADGYLFPGALGHLLAPFRDNPRVEIACGSPVPEVQTASPRGLVAEFLWRIHNRTLETLSNLRTDNHCCDEFMAFRRGFVETLPADLINDGAYLGVLASLHGLSVLFRPGAKVSIEIPSNFLGVVRQRRRILQGHHQIQQLLNHPVNTLEGMLTSRPEIVFRIIMGELRERPAQLFALLFLALPMEFWAHLLTFMDGLGGAPYQPAWNPVE